MTKGIVFDLDGTLIDSLAITIEAFNRGITHFGLPQKSPQEILSYFGPGEGEIFEKIVGKKDAAQAYQVARAYMDAHVGKIPLHDGVAELLGKIRAQEIPMSIFTGRGQETTEMILNYHQIKNQFVSVITSDHVEQPKPSPEGLFKVLEKMNMNPSDILFVGDSPVDMQAAHVSGANGVAALWDIMAERQGLELWKPKHWAKKPAEVWEIVKQMK